MANPVSTRECGDLESEELQVCNYDELEEESEKSS